MNDGIRTPLEHVEEALVAADMAWWELEFPSGALRFSKNKTDMLGYEQKDFIHFTHFTSLIHPKDFDASMKAMSDHYEGKTERYETTYRIKAADGTYAQFHDKGKIVERSDHGFVVAGIVHKIG